MKFSTQIGRLQVVVRVVHFFMKNLSDLKVWGPDRKTIPFDSLIKSVYGTDSIREGLGASPGQKPRKNGKIVKNVEFQKSSCYK